jgi:hypothetical protein
MADAHLVEPTFTATMTRDGTYCVQLDQHADAPVLHIGSFDSEGDAQSCTRHDPPAYGLQRRRHFLPRDDPPKTTTGAS